MPMYYPDLKSVQKCAEIMMNHKDNKKYKGLYPNTEEELPQARKELGDYFRKIWKDEIQALEVEMGVTEENYQEKLTEAIRKRFE